MILILWDTYANGPLGASDVIQHGGFFLHFSLFHYIFRFSPRHLTFYSENTLFNSLAFFALQLLVAYNMTLKA